VLAVDWLRGLAVMVMIQCHAMVLMLPALRTTHAFRVLVRIDGLVAPAFILAAGFSLGLILVRAAAQGKLADRMKKTSRRVAEVFAVAAAYTIRFLDGLHTPASWARVEILHCIALSLVVCFTLAAALASRPLALSLVAPALGYLVFALSPFAEHVQGPLNHLVNPNSGSMFPLCPWMGYALIGLTLGAESARAGTRGLLRACLILLAVGVVLDHFRRQLVAAYPAHNEWVTSPAEAGLRVAQVMGVTLALMGVEKWVRQAEKLPPLRVLGFYGTNSLGGYFFHEVFIYVPLFGLSFTRFWQDSCGWWAYAGLTVALIALTAVACVAWDYLWTRFSEELSRRWAQLRGIVPRRSPSSG
jgi:uncharacterized membrane protein